MCECECVLFAILTLTFTSYISGWMEVPSAWSWDVITLTGAVEGSIRIVAAWVLSAGLLPRLAFVEIWKTQINS